MHLEIKNKQTKTKYSFFFTDHIEALVWTMKMQVYLFQYVLDSNFIKRENLSYAIIGYEPTIQIKWHR